jgi:cardiolipin synthase
MAPPAGGEQRRDETDPMLTSLPNLLTLSRIFVIPPVIGAFYLDGDIANWVACALFTAASLTDFLDGYVARSLSQQTKLGRFLDPVADKLLVAAAILMLVAFDRISGLLVMPAMVILCREIMVSGLREFLAELRVSVPVSRLAKWKTTLQMLAISFLLLSDAGPAAIPVQLIGEIGLWIAAVLTIITGYDYLRAGLKYMTRQDSAENIEHRPAEPASVKPAKSSRPML